MTWSEFLAEMRSDLQDEGTTQRWSDKMLYIYTKDGIRDYSTWFPKRVDRLVLTLSPDGQSYPLPVDYIEDISVECPIDTFLERRATRPGLRYRNTPRPFSYYVSGGGLYISAPADNAWLQNLFSSPAEVTVNLTYFSSHPVPASEADTTFALTIPDADVELIRLYIKAKVYSQMRGKQAALDRFKLGTGKRDDNPLLPEVDDLMAEYHRGIAERLPGGCIYLYRPGRMR
jgi:hypothetical protein